jgi:energy-coupling factor transporter ATP-binding protein EcfA2
MRLVAFRVERFRNILDSGEIPVDPAVTCLVGKNESGKTNLLHALHTINPAPTERKFDEQQYPRWLQKPHQRTGEYSAAKPITAVFELSDDDMTTASTQFGDEVLQSRTWTVSLKYDGTCPNTIELDEEAACRAFEARHQTGTGAVKLAGLRTELDKMAAATAPDTAGTQVSTPAAVKGKAARDALSKLYPETLDVMVFRFLWARRPRFFYFSEYSQLRGRTEIGPLIQALHTNTEATLTEPQRTALSLLRLGFASESLVSADYEKRSGEMESVAADLTQQVKAYWHQNESLRLRIDIEPEEQVLGDGTHIVNRYLQLRVEDTRHYFTNNLDVRSSGFRWFISFLASFKEFETDRSVVVLLDEPALALHARAQRDFLAFIEDTLGAGHQVIYTTHSPFMVDAGHLERVRVVEDMGPDLGTVVKKQLMSRDPDTLSPLQGALGYDIAQNIFVGPDNLVVEGLSDYTYLVVMSEVLRAQGRAFLDARWRVLPAGGAGTMPAAVSLLGQQLDVTVVADGGSKPPQKLNALVDEGVLESKRIIMIGPIVGMSSADIEDLFDPDDYLSLYNAALGHSVTLGDIGPGPDRILGRIERKVGKFNHNDPSNWLLANRGTATASMQPATLARFEALVQSINTTLA